MNYFAFFLTLLLFSSFSHAAETDPSNGNLIPEPLLQDYVNANRSPGILVEPYDISGEDDTESTSI